MISTIELTITDEENDKALSFKIISQDDAILVSVDNKLIGAVDFGDFQDFAKDTTAYIETLKKAKLL